MTTEIEVVPLPIVKPRFSWPLALAILALGLIVAVFTVTLSTTATQIAGQPVAERVNLTSSQGPILAKSVAAIERNEASRQQAIEAEAARYTRLSMFYTTGNETNVERVIAAEVARYNGLAEFYLTENEAKRLQLGGP